MKWSSVKNLILGLLIVMNLYMLGVTVAKRLSSEQIPPLVQTAAVDAMTNNGIGIDSSLMPERYLTVRTFNGSFPTAMELSRMFFGEQLAFQTEERTLIARKDGAELRVDDESFSYSGGENAVPSTEKEFIKALKALGLEMDRACYMGNGEFALYYDSRPVFGAYIRAALDSDGNPVSVEARWPRIGHATGRMTGVSIIDRIPELIELFPEGGTVTGLEIGYSAHRNENTGAFSFEPAWRVTMEDGRTEMIG